MERRKALLLLAMLPVMLSSYAQSKMNTVYNIYLTKVQYSYSEPKTTLVGALAAVVDVATSNNLTRQMSEYVPSVGTVVKSAVPKVPYLCVKEGNLPAQPTPADYQLDTEVTSIGVSTTYKDKKDEIKWENNLKRLLELLIEEDPTEKIMKAEIFRNLGRFDDSMYVLKSYTFKENQWKLPQMLKECLEKN